MLHNDDKVSINDKLILKYLYKKLVCDLLDMSTWKNPKPYQNHNGTIKKLINSLSQLSLLEKEMLGIVTFNLGVYYFFNLSYGRLAFNCLTDTSLIYSSVIEELKKLILEKNSLELKENLTLVKNEIAKTQFLLAMSEIDERDNSEILINQLTELMLIDQNLKNAQQQLSNGKLNFKLNLSDWDDLKRDKISDEELIAIEEQIKENENAKNLSPSSTQDSQKMTRYSSSYQPGSPRLYHTSTSNSDSTDHSASSSISNENEDTRKEEKRFNLCKVM